MDQIAKRKVSQEINDKEPSLEKQKKIEDNISENDESFKPNDITESSSENEEQVSSKHSSIDIKKYKEFCLQNPQFEKEVENDIQKSNESQNEHNQQQIEQKNDENIKEKNEELNIQQNQEFAIDQNQEIQNKTDTTGKIINNDKDDSQFEIIQKQKEQCQDQKDEKCQDLEKNQDQCLNNQQNSIQLEQQKNQLDQQKETQIEQKIIINSEENNEVQEQDQIKIQISINDAAKCQQELKN